MNDDITLSALVVLRPRRPASEPHGIHGRTGINDLPGREAVEDAIEFFARRGFTIGNFVGKSFLIKGHSHQLESLFGQTLEIRRRGGRVEGGSLNRVCSDARQSRRAHSIGHFPSQIRSVRKRSHCTM